MMENNSIEIHDGIISKCLFRWILGISIVVSSALIILFWQNRTWNSSWPVDNGLFGTYGDFIGGVVGTIIAFYSAYLLVRTFQSQEQVNRNVITTNQNIIKTNNTTSVVNEKQLYNTLLEVFNSKFGQFISAYQSAIDNYVFSTDKGKEVGRKAFETLAAQFIEEQFINENDYYRRCQSAVSVYMDYYSKNRHYLAVHFRMLYLLTSLVSTSDLDKEDKVLYAKLIRGQLSESEMTMLRYNCHSEYGMKMQAYCNEFNLIKHLPIMQLLEFRQHYNIIKDSIEKVGGEYLRELVVGLDTMFITLRKYAKIMLEDNTIHEKTYDKCKGYTIAMSISDDKKRFVFALTRDPNVERRGGGTGLSATEKALDCFTKEQLNELFRDYLNELFYASNYYQYNGRKNVQKGKISQEGKISQKRKKSQKKKESKYLLTFMIESDKQLALSFKQMKERSQNRLEN